LVKLEWKALFDWAIDQREADADRLACSTDLEHASAAERHIAPHDGFRIAALERADVS
jgi:hypothetical protein